MRKPVISTVLVSLLLGFAGSHLIIQSSQSVNPEYASRFIDNNPEKKGLCQGLSLRPQDQRSIEVKAGFPLKLVENKQTDIVCGSVDDDVLKVNDYYRFRNFYLNWLAYSALIGGLIYAVSLTVKKKK